MLVLTSGKLYQCIDAATGKDVTDEVEFLEKPFELLLPNSSTLFVRQACLIIADQRIDGWRTSDEGGILTIRDMQSKVIKKCGGYGCQSAKAKISGNSTYFASFDKRKILACHRNDEGEIIDEELLLETGQEFQGWDVSSDGDIYLAIDGGILKYSNQKGTYHLECSISYLRLVGLFQLSGIFRMVRMGSTTLWVGLSDQGIW